MELLVDVARRKEKHGLGQGVIAHVEQRAEDRESGIHAHGRADQADVFQTGVSQHPLEVLLHENERPGQQHREQPETEQQVAAEPGAETRGRENMEPQQGIDGDLE